MATTTKAQLEAQTEHLTAAQAALFATLNKTQQSAFLEAFPVPVEHTGPLHLVVKLDGAKVAGFPSWMLAKKLVGANRLADIMDAASAAISEGAVDTETGEPITRATLNAKLSVEFVHSAESSPVIVGGVELDTEAAHTARAERDAEYRAANPRQGNGAAQVFTPVAQMP